MKRCVVELEAQERETLTLDECERSARMFCERWGGSNEEDNLVTACWPCRFSRHEHRIERCSALADHPNPEAHVTGSIIVRNGNLAKSVSRV